MPALMDTGGLPIETTMSKQAWRVYLAGGMAAVALYFLLPLDGLWSSLAYDLIGLSSVAAIVVGVRRLRPARPLIWWCFAAGQLLFVVGDMLYAVLTPSCIKARSLRSLMCSTWAAIRSWQWGC